MRERHRWTVRGETVREEASKLAQSAPSSLAVLTDRVALNVISVALAAQPRDDRSKRGGPGRRAADEAWSG